MLSLFGQTRHPSTHWHLQQNTSEWAGQSSMVAIPGCSKIWVAGKFRCRPDAGSQSVTRADELFESAPSTIPTCTLTALAGASADSTDFGPVHPVEALFYGPLTISLTLPEVWNAASAFIIFSHKINTYIIIVCSPTVEHGRSKYSECSKWPHYMNII